MIIKLLFGALPLSTKIKHNIFPNRCEKVGELGLFTEDNRKKVFIFFNIAETL